MHADQSARVGKGAANLLQRDRRCVGRHDGIRLHRRLGGSEDRLFDLQTLGHRLDHQIGVTQAGSLGIGDKAGKRILDTLRILQPPLIQRACARHRPVNGGRIEILQRHRKAGHGRHGGDIAAHRAGTDDMDAGDA